MTTENRRSFLRNILAGGAAAAVAKAAPDAPPEPVVITKTVTVEKVVEKVILKDIPNNVSASEMVIWLTITARRRRAAEAEKNQAQNEGRYFG